ncbi:peptidoglycan DD-metalloendopeptidase family protein [Salinimicrobium sp. GXAS 041]|uniref:peptidoglycan DD-metalloendopeptidase family protein n=1 Tax=Salinimicrobium sp. GXAS 041 TaxID=3400806 RepID=UPI003C771178
MKKKQTVLQIFAGVIFIALVISSCSRINKVKDLVINPSAREIYSREFKENPQQYAIWEKQAENALFDSLAVNLPYAENGIFTPGSFPIYAYDIALNPGERINVDIDTDSAQTRVFIDLYEQQDDSLKTFKHLKSADLEASALAEEITQPGIYKIVIQPEINANTPFDLQLYREPVYKFPVAAKKSKNIQSFWGAVRDGGRRSHEGVDIFAPRGTPVIAATSGRVTRTGNRGLGGKQVWLRDGKRGNSLYYAHLNSIIATSGQRVSPGDTLGLVGNTGNARTTPPHLHFGIYKGYRGAVDPFNYIAETEPPVTRDVSAEKFSEFLVVTGARANLRGGPSTNFPVLGQLQAQDTLQFLGKAKDWYHIRTNQKRSFIHESLVSPI